jgi:hypothetical protein
MRNLIWTVRWQVILIRLMTLVIGALSLGILGMRYFASMHAEQTPDNPFTAYQALRPGNSQAALDGYHCESPDLLAASGLTSSFYYCNINLEDSQIRLVTITVHDGLIRRQDLFVRGLRLGDLVMRWGEPDRWMRQQGDLCLLSWDEGITAAARCDSWLNDQAEVESITWSKPRPLSQA